MHRTFSVIVLMLLFASGCFSHRSLTQQIDADKSSLLYGYIDMVDAPATKVTAFTLKQVLPKTDKPYWHMRTYDGAFYLENIPPGSYQFSQFGGPGGIFSSASFYWFNFPTQNDGFRIGNSGLYYLGSYKYKKAGSFFNPKFDIESTGSPGEREVIEKILPYSAGTKWEDLLRKRLAQLGGGASK